MKQAFHTRILHIHGRFLALLFAAMIASACGSSATDREDPAATEDDPAEGESTPVSTLPSLESLRNTNALFRRHAQKTQAQLKDMGGFLHDDFSVVSRPDNGPGPGQGQFRINCQWSHFGWDDPIVHAGKPGGSHLHMFWGNTITNAFTTFNQPTNPADSNDILEHGGSTCQGFELNRSAYWIPALIDTSDAKAHKAVIPQSILLYYKSHRPNEVHELPQGIEFLAGSVDEQGRVQQSFTLSSSLSWGCGRSGHHYNRQTTIPTNCNPGDPIHAVIPFPQCLAVDEQGNPVLRSDNHVSHARRVAPELPCPASHPYRVPQISYLIYWPNGDDDAGAGVEHWRLSSDHTVHSQNTAAHPGGSLHGDWLGGWNEETIQLWTRGCFDPEGVNQGPRNCSRGQTGPNGTGRAFQLISPLNNYEGPYFFPLPQADMHMGH